MNSPSQETRLHSDPDKFDPFVEKFDLLVEKRLSFCHKPARYQFPVLSERFEAVENQRPCEEPIPTGTSICVATQSVSALAPAASTHTATETPAAPWTHAAGPHSTSWTHATACTITLSRTVAPSGTGNLRHGDAALTGALDHLLMDLLAVALSFLRS
jgi:hypothetical protein